MNLLTELAAWSDKMRIRSLSVRSLVLVLLSTVFLRSVYAQEDNQDLTAQSLEQLMGTSVVSAALHEQNLTDAPGDVTVITSDEIRRWGYRTLADALSYVRGFYITSDRSYNYLGVRGFSLPGDYDTRIIVMINGHSLTENIFDMAGWFGNDFPVDISLVDRIEIMRGASSALYGSNGMLATINVITKRPNEAKGTSVRIDTDSLRERKGQVSVSVPAGKANLLFSTSVFNNAGAHELYFNEFDTPQTNFGRAIDMDGEKGYHVFADLTWGNWEALAVAGDRVKTQPVSWGTTVFNDPGTSAEDSRGFLDLSYTKDLPGDRTLSWRASYDEYRYRGIYHYDTDTGVLDNRECDYGDWMGSRFTYRLPDSKSGHLTLGTDVKIDLRTLQNVFNVYPETNQILWINTPDRYVGVFAQQEWDLGPHWELNLGGRFDWSWLRQNSVSPRAALIYKPSPKTDLKLLYGRGFRNPNSYAMFWTDNGLSQMSNPALQPETDDSYELDAEHHITKRVRAAVSLYRYQVNNLIQQIYTSTDLLQYVNAGAVHASGASFELDMKLPAGLEALSSLEMQRAVFGDRSVLPNSPGQVGKFRLSIPLWRNRLALGTGLQALGQRQTYAGVTLPWAILPEVVLSTRQLPNGLEVSGGIKDLSNSFYREPIGLVSTVDSIIGNGRTYYITLGWHSSGERESGSSRTPGSGPHAKIAD